MAKDQSTHPLPDLTREPQRSLRTDGCPECCTHRGNHPVWTRDDGTGTGFFAWYHCTCGHWWTTGWADE